LPAIGALLTGPPRSADAVRFTGADCIGVEFIAELPAGAADVMGCAGSGGVVVGPLKWTGCCPVIMSGVRT
jgi:hypothetical protein